MQQPGWLWLCYDQMTAIKMLRKNPQRPLAVLQMNKENCVAIVVDLVGANDFLAIYFLNMISCYKQDHTQY